jgi:5-methylcytosine-specific restriction endonuclease McrA
MPEAIREKHSVAMKERHYHMSEESKAKLSSRCKGRRHSPETKEKMRMASIRYWRGPQSTEAKRRVSEALSGERCHLWRGGITQLSHLLRSSFKNRQWRSDIFTRDDFTCVLCGIRGCYLEADHFPKRFADIFQDNAIKTLEQGLACEEFWDINNGRTLCLECHRKTKEVRK